MSAPQENKVAVTSAPSVADIPVSVSKEVPKEEAIKQQVATQPQPQQQNEMSSSTAAKDTMPTGDQPMAGNGSEGAVLELWPFSSPGLGAGWLSPWTTGFFSPLERSLFSKFDNAMAEPIRQLNDSLRMNMDWQENDGGYQLSVDLPGVPKDSVKLDIKGRQLTVTAEKQEEKKDDHGWTSRRWGKTQRTVTLPRNVDIDKINARCVDGQLRIQIPKSASSTQDRSVKIE
jgi:HSP20 family protein